MYISQCFPPREDLSEFLSGIYIIKSPKEITINTLPQPNVTLTITCRGAVQVHNGKEYTRLPEAMITTGYNARRQYRLTAGTSLIIVNFKACALGAFFRLSPNDGIHDLKCMTDNTPALKLSDILQPGLSDKERITLTELLLYSQLNTKKADTMMMSAADQIRSTKGVLKISRLYQSLYLSESQFEKRFRRSAGCSAKKYASVVRIHKIITGETEGTDITDKAYEAGYFDQAHFIRDFKAYTGYTPKRFFKLQKEWPYSLPDLGLVYSGID